MVIAIIALLMGILMPALSKARKQGRDVYCLNNLRQMGVAVQMYTQEYDDFIPRALDNQQAKWILVFTPFLGEQYREAKDYREVPIYQCPSFPRDGIGAEQCAQRRADGGLCRQCLGHGQPGPEHRR